MDLSQPVSEMQVFHTTPRRREKPCVNLTNVTILTNSRLPTPVDLFDALLKGPFTAIGRHTYRSSNKLKVIGPTPCNIKISDVVNFSIEEDRSQSPSSVKIWLEGTLAWYRIVSPSPEYEAIFADMQLKAQIWIWIQYQRSEQLRSTRSTTYPTLEMIRRDLPAHFKLRTGDPIDAFHPYFIERVIQSDKLEETLACVGQPNVNPQWMNCQFVKDLQKKYRTTWRFMLDRVETIVNQGSRVFQPDLEESTSPVPPQFKVQKTSKETRQLLRLFLADANSIKLSPHLTAAAIVIHNSLPTSHPWKSTSSEILEKIENHAEALLSDSSFTITFQDWSGLSDLKNFSSDKKWWKRQPSTRNAERPRPVPRRHLRIPRDSSIELSQPTTRATSVSIASTDLSIDDLAMQTPVPRRTAKKGTSVLRPSMSVTQTPATPIKKGRNAVTGSVSPMVLIDLTNTDDDELQLITVPPDVSKRLQKEKKGGVKRKFEVHIDEPGRPSRKTRLDKKGIKTKIDPLQLTLTRAPLTTVTLPLSTNERSTTFRCSFPDCTYTRLVAASSTSKAEIDKHHLSHRDELRNALDMIKDPFISGGRVGGEKGNRLVRPIGAIDHLVERIEEMAKGLGSTPSKRLVV